MARAIVVEDRAAGRIKLARMLEGAGHVVSLARNGVEAVELYEIVHPDVVLMDLFMPIMNGFDAIHFICSDYPDARIIALCDLGNRVGLDAIAEAQALGAVCAVEKPVQRGELLAAVDELLVS